MYADLLQRLELGLVRRNPGIAPKLQPGLPPDSIKQQLKRAGIKKGNVDPIVALYAWHDGYQNVGNESEAGRLGFAPPTVSPVPQAHIEHLLNCGLKVDPNSKIYGEFKWINLSYVIWHLKHWKKWSPKVPRYAILLGRAVPFLVKGDQTLAFDTDTSANGRIISIQDDKVKGEPPLREAYASFEAFLLDAIRANETNQLLTWPQIPGNPIELPMPAPVTSKSSAKSKKRMIPASESLLVLRTDFSDEAAWESLRATLTKPDDELAPTLDFLSDPTFTGLTPRQLPKLMSEEASHLFAVIVDQTTLTHPDHPLLVVDLQEKPGRSFRTTAAALAEVHDNLSTANMEFSEFADAVDSDGIFRGVEE